MPSLFRSRFRFRFQEDDNQKKVGLQGATTVLDSLLTNG